MVGAGLKVQVANDQVPPVVLLPTPPTTTAPNAKHPLVELQTELHSPPPMKPPIACARFFSPPTMLE